MDNRTCRHPGSPTGTGLPLVPTEVQERGQCLPQSRRRPTLWNERRHWPFGGCRCQSPGRWIQGLTDSVLIDAESKGPLAAPQGCGSSPWFLCDPSHACSLYRKKAILNPDRRPANGDFEAVEEAQAGREDPSPGPVGTALSGFTQTQDGSPTLRAVGVGVGGRQGGRRPRGWTQLAGSGDDRFIHQCLMKGAGTCGWSEGENNPSGGSAGARAAT